MPLAAEPFFEKTENRAYFGTADGDTKGGILSMPYPTRTGDSISQLWQVHWYGASGAGASVMPMNEVGVMQRFVSGHVPRHALADGGKIIIDLEGIMQPKSMRPRMIFLPVLGDALLKPSSFTYLSTTYGQHGIEVSIETMGQNVLGGYDGWIDFHFHCEIASLGYLAAAPNPAVGTDGNISVRGFVEFGEQLTEFCGGGRRAVASRLHDWRPNRAASWTRGDLALVDGRLYKALVDQTVLAETGYSTSDWIASYETNKPGFGREWQQKWVDVRCRRQFSFLAEADLRANDLELHLDVGGPYQGDTQESYRAWVSSPSTQGGGYPSFYQEEAATGLVRNGGTDYVARINVVDGKPEPGVGAGWQQFWRPLDASRSDTMTLTSSRAVMIGGRAGLSQRYYN